MNWAYGIIASLIVIISGLLHGNWTDRWARSGETDRAAELLADVPMTIGEWEGRELEKASQPGPGVVGALQRTYVHRRRNTAVVIALVNGRPGPVATHTPEVCYGASGYLVGERKAVGLDIPGVPAQFWTSDAVKTNKTDETRIRLYWAWTAGGAGWAASKDARDEFPRYQHPVLHKLYVLRDLNAPAASSPDKEEPCEAFLKELLPVLQQKLFTPNG